MTSAVVDGSVALAWVLPGEADESSDEALARIETSGGAVPGLWALEIANTLLKAERRGRILARERHAHAAFLRALPITTDERTTEQVWTATLDLADRHGLTVYDATYLELALRLRVPLATRDKQLRQAAERSGLPVLG